MKDDDNTNHSGSVQGTTAASKEEGTKGNHDNAIKKMEYVDIQYMAVKRDNTNEG